MALPRDTPASSPPPSAFGRYRVVHQVGAGVLGPVFRGYDPEHDRAVAIKAFSLDLTPEQARDLAADLARLATLPLKHPSIIVPFDAGTEGATTYLVGEYFVAESADVALKQYGPAPVPDAMRLVGQLAGALDFAAAAGVHHGALHPRDILVAPHEVRLSGIGIVEALERVGYRPPVRRPYAAPERAQGGPFGTAADVYSLAGVCYELLTGRRPSLAGDTAAAVEVDAIHAADRPALVEAFARAFSAQPEDRHASALAFAAALKHALTGEPIVVADAAERPRARRALRSASRRTPVPGDPTPPPAAGEPPEVDRERDEALAAFSPGAATTPRPASTAVHDAEPGQLPLEPAEDERAIDQGHGAEADPRPVVAAPGSTPLPSFLEAYRPTSAEPIESSAPAPAPPDVASPEPEPGVPARQETTAPGAPEFDLSELDRRTDLTTAAPPATAEPLFATPATPPEPAPSLPPADDEADRRVEPTVVVPSVRDSVPEPPPAAPPPPASRRDDEPFGRPPLPREPVLVGSEAPAMHPPEPRPKNYLVSLLGMLLVGILIGFPVGYLVAPKGAPEPAASGSSPAAEQPPRQEPGTVPAPTGAPAPSGFTAPVPGSVAPPAAAPPVSPGPAPAAIEGAKPPSAPPPASAKPGVKPATRGGTTQRARTESARTPSGQPSAAKKPAAARATFEGTLMVASKPDGATVQLDGKVVGKTPLSLPTVAAGAHAIRIELAGYQVWSSSIQVTAGRVNRVTASLERRPGG